MAEIGVDRLRVVLRSAGARWQAGVTSVSNLDLNSRKKRLGLVITDTEMKRLQARRLLEAPVAAAAPISALRDWRNNLGKNWITSVKDQGNCAACVSFSVVAVMEAMARIQNGAPEWNLDLSEAALFFCGASKKCNEGWWPPDAFSYAKTNGVVAESVFPYQDRDIDCQLSGQRPPVVTATEYQEIVDVALRKVFLDTKGPLLACMAVYDDFFNYRSGIYHHVTGDLMGYHAVTCVGYNETDGCWICKNSWGTDWGENGFFRIAYGEAEIESKFAMYGVTAIGGTLRPQSPTNDDGPVQVDMLVADRSFVGNRSVLWLHVAAGWKRVAMDTNELLSLADVLLRADSVRTEVSGEIIQRILAVRKYPPES